MKASDYIANYIAALGVRHVFTVAGGNSMHLNDSFGHRPDITPVYMLDERGAAIAAEAYAKASGKIGVCIVTAGPGVTNAITGCAAAWLESTPVLFISGDAKTADLNRRDVYGLRQAAQQDVNTFGLVKPVVKWVRSARATKVPEVMLDLTGIAINGRPGPVWLSVPLDVQAQDVGNPEIVLPQIQRPALNDNDIAKVAKLLETARRPLLLLGAGISIAHARNEVAELIDYLGVPVMTTWPATDLIACNHPLFVGRPGPVGLRAANKALQECDLLISIGARLDPVTTAYNVGDFGRLAKRIMVDIDQSEIDKNQNDIEMGIRADASDFICALQANAQPAIHPDWVMHCQDIKAQYPLEALGDSPSYRLTRILSEITMPDDIFANGVASYAFAIFSAGFKQKAGQRLYSAYALGSMGFDVPNAIGACLGSGGKRTICITGDGSFMQNVQELEVVWRMKLPIVFFVASNGGYGLIERSQQRAFGRLSGANADSGLTLPSPARLAQSTGISGTKWYNHDEMTWKTVKYSLDGGLPRVVEYLAQDEPELPHVVSTFDAQGVPHSGALDKMWPYEV